MSERGTARAVAPRPVVWKRLPAGGDAGAARVADTSADEADQEHPASPWIDPAAFLGNLAPELARRLGLKVGARVLTAPPAQPRPLIRLAQLDAGGQRLALDLERGVAGLLLRRALGGRAVDAADPEALIRQLAPSGASWQALSGLAAAACHAALARSAAFTLGAPAPMGRIAPPDPAERDLPLAQGLWFELAVDGERFAGRLGLVARPERQVPQPPAGRAMSAAGSDTARRQWAERLPRALAAVECRVAIRIAELRLPIDGIMALRSGDVLSIQRPRGLSLSVDGQTLPAAQPRTPHP